MSGEMWAVVIVAVVFAALIGFLAGRSGGKSAKKKLDELETELARKGGELEDYKRRVDAHFDRSAELFVSMAGSYKSLFEHLSSGYEQLSDGRSGRDLFRERVATLLLDGPQPAAQAFEAAEAAEVEEGVKADEPASVQEEAAEAQAVAETTDAREDAAETAEAAEPAAAAAAARVEPVLGEESSATDRTETAAETSETAPDSAAEAVPEAREDSSGQASSEPAERKA